MIYIILRMISGFVGAAAIGISAYRVLRYYKFKGSLQLGVFLLASAASNLVIAWLSLEVILRAQPVNINTGFTVFLIVQIVESIAAMGFASYLLDVFGAADDHGKKEKAHE